MRLGPGADPGFGQEAVSRGLVWCVSGGFYVVGGVNCKMRNAIFAFCNLCILKCKDYMFLSKWSGIKLEKALKKLRFSRIYETGTLPALVIADSCSLQGRVSRLEQRNLLQFARVPTKLSGGFTAAFFLPFFKYLKMALLLLRSQSTYNPGGSSPVVFQLRPCF